MPRGLTGAPSPTWTPRLVHTIDSAPGHTKRRLPNRRDASGFDCGVYAICDQGKSVDNSIQSLLDAIGIGQNTEKARVSLRNIGADRDSGIIARWSALLVHLTESKYADCPNLNAANSGRIRDSNNDYRNLARAFRHCGRDHSNRSRMFLLQPPDLPNLTKFGRNTPPGRFIHL